MADAAADLAHRAGPLRAMQAAIAAAAQSGAVTLRELPFLAQIGLRGPAEDAKFAAAVRTTLGIEVPQQPNTAVVAEDRAALWLGPDEWLLVASPGAERDLVAQLAAALAGLHAAITDLSASRTVLELAGPRSRDVLRKGCGLDLHPRVFRTGQCAQSALARAPVILQQTDELPRWRIYVRNSFAPYLAAWLIDAMREYRAG